MKELERHIEILLLSNDCVIVPELGGFVAHYIHARYDEDSCVFLPPLRTVGFNPMLKMNDSVLAQSYVDTYDISYPQALSRIEDEVKGLRNNLETNGFYELSSIGKLWVNHEGKLEFTPVLAGVLSPELYGLSSCELKQLAAGSQETIPATVKSDAQNNASTKAKVVDIQASQQNEKVITVKVSMLRNAIVAAVAIVACVLFVKPVNNIKRSEKIQSSVIQNIMPKSVTTGTPDLNAVHNKIIPTRKQEDKTQALSKQKEEEKINSSKPSFCIVLACGITRKNAELFAEDIRKQGFAETIVLNQSGIRVVYGNYGSQDEAYTALRKLSSNKNFKQGWVMKIK